MFLPQRAYLFFFNQTHVQMCADARDQLLLISRTFGLSDNTICVGNWCPLVPMATITVLVASLGTWRSGSALALAEHAGVLGSIPSVAPKAVSTHKVTSRTAGDNLSLSLINKGTATRTRARTNYRRFAPGQHRLAQASTGSQPHLPGVRVRLGSLSSRKGSP